MSEQRLYRGDVVWISVGPDIARGIVRELAGERAKVQIGRDWTWIFTEECSWNGESIAARLPITERGWRKLGMAISVKKNAYLPRNGHRNGR